MAQPPALAANRFALNPALTREAGFSGRRTLAEATRIA
jgi:hypothetical protein